MIWNKQHDVSGKQTRCWRQGCDCVIGAGQHISCPRLFWGAEAKSGMCCL